MNNSRVRLTFAGQAGVILDCDGYRVGIDLYLSDCCDRYFGFKRLMPYLFDPRTLNLDLLVATHAHYDHFDPDSVPLILSNAKTQVVAACDVKAEAERLNLEPQRFTYLKEGDVFQNEYVRITAVPCDHGVDTPDAIGLFVELGGKTMYIAGDTAYREEYFKDPAVQHPDVFMMPINGAFGNLNEEQGAAAAALVGAKLTIPCHYWNFAQHGGDPYRFMKTMDEQYPERAYWLMRPGETMEVTS